jgi:hypothetical protein
MSIQLYYFPYYAEYYDQAPLYFQRPNSNWKEFSEDVARNYPKCKFYIETHSNKEIQQSCENLRTALEEFK